MANSWIDSDDLQPAQLKIPLDVSMHYLQFGAPLQFCLNSVTSLLVRELWIAVSVTLLCKMLTG